MGAVTASDRLVVLSPHLDDAVLGAGALIADEVRAGVPVEVWTAFTRQPEPAAVPRRLRPFADYRTRLAEDDRALAVLGAGARRLDLPERIWRDPPARGLRAAFRTPADRAGLDQLEPVAAAVAEAFARPGTRVLAPLGVGHHVDHVEVACAALVAAVRAGACDRIGFYEDFYALAGAARRRHPVTRAHAGGPVRRLREAPGWAGPAEGLVLWATPLIARGPTWEAWLPELAGLAWTCAAHPVDDRSQRQALAALAEYRSQTPALGGLRQLAAIQRRAHRLRDGELIWSVRRR